MGKVQKEQDQQMICSAAGKTPRCWTPKSLMLESHEIEGARKLLLKLQQDYAMLLVPTVKCKAKSTTNESLGLKQTTDYEYFPIATKYRKIVGDGMMRFLLTDKENIRRYLYEDCDLDMKFTHDKKGKPVRCDITIRKNK